MFYNVHLAGFWVEGPENAVHFAGFCVFLSTQTMCVFAMGASLRHRRRRSVCNTKLTLRGDERKTGDERDSSWCMFYIVHLAVLRISVPPKGNVFHLVRLFGWTTPAFRSNQFGWRKAESTVYLTGFVYFCLAKGCVSFTMGGQLHRETT